MNDATFEVPKDQGPESVYLKVDCDHHTRNFIIGDVSKECCLHAKEDTLDYLNVIDTRLRVKVDIMCITRSVCK